VVGHAHSMRGSDLELETGCEGCGCNAWLSAQWLFYGGGEGRLCNKSMTIDFEGGTSWLRLDAEYLPFALVL
jgi:hypothetical protein